MRKIRKGSAPSELLRWKKANPTAAYKDLKSEPDVRRAIRLACLQEQFYLCAYCCKKISINTAHNEHIKCQKNYEILSLDFNNIVASCNNPLNCGKAKGQKELSLTPFLAECQIEIKFYMSGKAKGQTDRANNALETLNLDRNIGLRQERKQLVDTLIYTQGTSPDELELLDKDLAVLMLDSLEKPEEGALASFSPVLINIIKSIYQI